MSFVAISAGVGVAGLASKLIGRHSANQRLKSLQGQDPTYTANPLVAQRLGLASALLNARAPGAASAEQGIYNTAANQISNAQRGATDSNQLLLSGGKAASMADESLDDLQTKEEQDYERRLGNYNGANEASVSEDNKVFQDQTRRFNDKAQIQGAISANNTNAAMDVSNFGFGLADLGINGGYQNMLRRQRAQANPNAGYNTYGWTNIPSING